MHYPIRVLFVCNRNSTRAPMARALLEHIGKEDFQVECAGVRLNGGVNGQMVKILERLGIAVHHPDCHGLDDYIGQQFDYVITLCDKSCENLPDVPGDFRHVCWDFADPEERQMDAAAQERFLRHLCMEMAERIRLWVELEHHQLWEQGLVNRNKYAPLRVN